MYARKLLAGVATGAVALAMTALAAVPASAVTSNPQPDDTAGTPTSAHLVGVGSDTSQRAVKLVGDRYNATSPANPIFTYAACATSATCGTVTLPSKDINRPNGSTAGKSLLRGGAGDVGDLDIDFARSSSALSSAEVGSGLQLFPFALDVLVSATSGNVASNAPASLTRAQLLQIYEGSVTDWGALGGTPGATIVPLLPQDTSGTRAFFLAQLAEQKGAAVNLAASVQSVQEHDPGPIQNDPNAVAPYSKGRAGLSGTALRVQGGFEAQRALYNVVRGSQQGDPGIQAAFGPNGFFCSEAATSAIEESGFRQLSRATAGGVCGEATQSATSNFTTSVVQTSTNVTVSSASASAARVVARVTAGSAPNGRVSFFEGGTLIASNVPLVSGAATITPSAAPGVHTYRAVFTPSANSSFQPSEGVGTGTVQKASSSISESFPAKVVQGKKVKGTVTVALNGSSAKAGGSITIKEGSKTLVTKGLSGGSVDVKLPKLKKGKHTLVISWGGDANGNSSTLTFKVKVKKAPKKK